jgi:hypothetical protein
MSEFQAGRFLFALPDGGEEEVPFDVEIDEEEFDFLLEKARAVPENLGRAPVASWALARLAHLLQGQLGRGGAGRQTNDGGGYVLDFLILREDRTPLGSVQVQGDMEGVVLLGGCAEGQDPAEVVDQLARALGREPDRVAVCRVEVADPEWKEDPFAYRPVPNDASLNLYGWDGRHYLGADNVRERHH